MEEHGEMQSPDISGAIEALLFVSDEPVGALTIAEMLEVDLKSVEAALDAIRARLEAEDRGVQLREVAGGWRFYTHPRHHGLIEKYVLSWDTRKLTQAALETLAVIAYNQPITRAGVTSVRGVNSDSPINSLVEKGLVREAGRDKNAPGQPILYATSRTFLEKFGLASTRDLPNLEDFAPDEQSRELIRERLGATRKAHEEQVATLFDDDLTLDLGLDESERIVGDFAPAIEGEEDDELAATSGMGDAIAQTFGMPETVWSVDEGGEEGTRGVESDACGAEADARDVEGDARRCESNLIGAEDDACSAEGAATNDESEA